MRARLRIGAGGVGDPERPIAAPEFANFVGERPPARRLRRFAKVIAAGLFDGLDAGLAVDAAGGAHQPAHDPAVVRRDRRQPGGTIIVLAVFIVGGLLVFPVMFLIAATAATFGPWLGFALAGAGTTASAILTYGVGARSAAMRSNI